MGDIEKLQRKMLKQAAEQQKLEVKAYQRRRKPVEESADPERLYCVRCTAMLKSDSTCPRCDHHQTNVMAYCRKCLGVHGTEATCKAWKPADGSDREHPETYRL